MARPLRIEFSDALYHVMSRGNDRRRIVRDDADRARRLDWLRRTVDAGEVYLDGWTIQLVDPGSGEGYYLEISRYIHLNPVRAKRVETPEDWPWSSYRGYHRRSGELSWVTYRRVLREFGRGVDKSRRAYRRYVAAGVESMPACPWADAVQGLIVGGETFVQKVRGMLAGRSEDRSLPAMKALRPRPALKRIASMVAEEFGADPSDWSAGRRHDDASRAVAAYLGRRRYGYRAGEVAKLLGYTSHGGVVAAIHRIETGSASLRRTVAKLEKKLTND